MDLHGWMNADLGTLRADLFGSVIALVPGALWHEQADGGGSTIIGLLLHLARHHDLAINAVIRNHPTLFTTHCDALGLADAPSGVALAEKEDLELTAKVAPEALTDYLTSVFDTTAAWLDRLGSLALDIEPHTDYRLTHQAGLDPSAFPWLYAGWRGRPVWWFVQWPVLGHGHAHVGEAISIRNRFGLSPF